jgi:hypothetical protein
MQPAGWCGQFSGLLVLVVHFLAGLATFLGGSGNVVQALSIIAVRPVTFALPRGSHRGPPASSVQFSAIRFSFPSVCGQVQATFGVGPLNKRNGGLYSVPGVCTE